MSSGVTKPAQVRRRRLQGACDICRQRKIRCDSAKMPDNRCTNCIEFGADCTHVHVLKQKTVYKFKPVFPQETTQLPDLLSEQRDNLKPLIDAILAPRYQTPTSNPAIIRDTLISLATYIRVLEKTIANHAKEGSHPPEASPTSRSTTAERETSGNRVDPSEVDVDALAADLRKRLDLGTSRNQFYPPSGLEGSEILITALEQSKSSDTPAVIQETRAKLPLTLKRPEFWIPPKGAVVVPESRPPLVFPEPDLLEHLVNLYFRVSNLYVPIIHRPTFDKELKSQLHLKDFAFGECVLAICAVASRYSSDKRVIPEGSATDRECGSQWYQQLKLTRDSSSSGTPTLYELQTYQLAVTYLHGTATPEKCWYLLGLAIRAAQDAGVHRRSKSTEPPTVESELRKRIWWALITTDLAYSFSTGRPRICQDFDQDLDLPIDCDDAYWEHPNPSLAFKQPAGKPSMTSAFIKFIEAHNILASAKRAFYSLKAPEPHPDLCLSQEEWDKKTLYELHLRLNAWADTVPDHLRWDPDREDSIFFDQSAVIYITFYWIQILVHRPFTSGGNLSASSFVICSHAARACSRVGEIHSYRGLVGFPQVQGALLNAGLILLLGIWRARKSGISLDEYNEMDGVYRCSRVLSVMEQRWHPPGRFNDVLRSLSLTSRLPFPELDTNSGFAWSDFSSNSTAQVPHISRSHSKSSSELESESSTYPAYHEDLSKPSYQLYQNPVVGHTFEGFQGAYGESMSAPPVFPNDCTAYDMSFSKSQGNDPSNPYDMQMDLNSVPAWAVSPTGLDWAAWNNHVTNFETLDRSGEPFESATLYQMC